MVKIEFDVLYCALLLKEIGVNPGGAPKTFCEPVYIASIPHLSANIGTPPSEATVSTANKQPYLGMQTKIKIFFSIVNF